MPTLTNSGGGSNTNYSVYIFAASDVVSLGNLHWYVSLSATAPSAADLVAGTNSVSFGSVAKNANASQTVNGGGLQPATAYYAYMLHDDGAQSNIVSTGPHTTEPASPAISLPVATNINATTVTLGCTSDVDVQAGGILYAVIDLPVNIDAIMDFHITSGNNENSTPALVFNNGAATGLNPTISMSATALTDGVTYGFALIYQDENANNSSALITGTFVHSTGAVANPGIRITDIYEPNTAAIVANATGVVTTVYDTQGGTELFHTTTATITSGDLEIDDDLVGAINDSVYITANWTVASDNYNFSGPITVINLDA